MQTEEHLGFRSYYNSEPIDLEGAKNVIVNQEKSTWLDNIKEKPKLDFLTSIKPEFGTEPYINPHTNMKKNSRF